jgi:hypothetical protein
MKLSNNCKKEEMLKTFGMEIGEHTVHDLEKNCFSFVCSSNSSSAMRNTKKNMKKFIMKTLIGQCLFGSINEGHAGCQSLD